MKTAGRILILLLASLSACFASPTQKESPPAPESVLITYYIRPGQEKAMQDVLAHEWNIYQREHLVLAQPHLLISDEGNGGKTRLIEIFTWVNGETPDHPPDDVKQIWKLMTSLCEARSGHNGIEGGEVELLVH